MNNREILAVQQYLASRPHGLVADLAFNGIEVFLPTRIAFSDFGVIGTAAATGHFDLAPVRQAIRSGTICYAVTQRAWAAAVAQGEDKPRGPFATDWWAAPVLRQLLPLFEPDTELGSLLLVRSPACATR